MMRPMVLEVALMHWFALALIFLATIAVMELFAYSMHRWVMHGPGWFCTKAITAREPGHSN